MVEKLVSGGQTGVDRAALDLALEVGLACGGWCPQGRRAEDGPIPARYPLVETGSPRYPVRTAWNVRDADATLVLCRGEPDGGTRLTVSEAVKKRRPYRVVDLADPEDPCEVAAWLEAGGVRILNVAGPRESSAPGIHRESLAYLRAVIATVGEGRPG